MDFNQLMSKMRAIDTATESAPTEAECAPMDTPMPTSMPQQSQTPPPSMNVNLNAQGMENIESMMKLFQKVNPDMMPKTPEPMPTLSIAPGMNKPEPMKMLPKMDAEAYANEPEEREMGIDSLVRDGNDLHKSKKTYPKVADGDNPRQAVENVDLDEAGSEARRFVQQIAQDLEDGAPESALENEFFDTLEMMGWDTDKIAAAWERITTPDVRVKPDDSIKGDLEKLAALGQDDDDEYDPDISAYQQKAKRGIKMDPTDFGAGLESYEARRNKIREDLQARFQNFKAK